MEQTGLQQRPRALRRAIGVLLLLFVQALSCAADSFAHSPGSDLLTERPARQGLFQQSASSPHPQIETHQGEGFGCLVYAPFSRIERLFLAWTPLVIKPFPCAYPLIDYSLVPPPKALPV